MINVGTIIKQNAAPHGDHRLGRGTRTIGQAGCLLSCITMAARVVGGRAGLDVLDAHTAIDARSGFAGSGLILDVALPTLGIEKVERGAFELDDVRADLLAGRPVVVGVDYREGASSGMSSADHFVLAVGFIEDMMVPTLQVADPAYGRIVMLPLLKQGADTQTIYKGAHADLVEMVRLAPRGTA